MKDHTRLSLPTRNSEASILVKHPFLRFTALIVLCVWIRAVAAEGIPNDRGTAPPDIAPLQAPFQMPLLERPTFPDQTFRITDYGAVGEGLTKNTEAFRKAIVACSQAGGGRVLVPPGKWLTGAIHLSSNVNLHLEDGAEIHFSDDPDDYLPVVFTRWAGIEVMNYSPLIYANGCHNIAITGKGALYGHGNNWWDWCSRLDEKDKIAPALMDLAAKGIPPEERVFGHPNSGLRPQFINPIHCRNVLLEGFTISAPGPFWTIHFVYCDGVIARDLTIQTQGGPNLDGINLDSTRNALIEYCSFDTDDDAIAVKSGMNEDGRRVGMPSENILIRHCHSKGPRWGSISIGSDMSGGVRRVCVEDVTFDGTLLGLYIKSNPGRGGTVEDIHYRRIRMRNIQLEAIRVQSDYAAWGAASDQTLYPTFRNIHFQDIVCDGAGGGALVQGMPQKPLENLHFERIAIDNAKSGMRFEHIQGLTLKEVSCNSAEDKAILFNDCRDVTHLDADVEMGRAGADSPRLSDQFGVVHGDPEFLVELGSGWNRHDFTWAGIEREKGVFDFGEFPSRVEKSLGMGVNLLPILDYEPAWDPDRSPADEETLRYWERYVETMVARFKGQLNYWQAWNEPNITFWKPKPNARDYAELLRRTYIAAKRADPEVKILGLNCSNIDLEFSERVFRYGGLNYCDVLAYQPYRIAPEAGHFEEVEALRELLEKFGQEKPIWFTEMGWASEHFAFSDAEDVFAERPMRRQAAFLVRYMAIIKAVDIEKVFWFSQTADTAALMVPHLGGRKRHSFYAYRHLIEGLDDYTDLREIFPHGSQGRYAYLFSCPERDVLIAWSVNGPQEVTIPGAGECIEAHDILGSILPNPAKDDKVILTGEPIFLFFDKTPAALCDLGSLSISPTRLWLEPGESQTIRVRWEPSPGVSENVRVRVESDHNGLSTALQNLDLEPGAPKEITITASQEMAPSRGSIRLSLGDLSWEVETNVTPKKLFHYRCDINGLLTPVALRKSDESLSLLIAAYDSNELICLAPDGTLRWEYIAGVPICGSVAVGNIDEDPASEIVTAMPRKQTIMALSEDGVLLWRAKLAGEPREEGPSWSWTQPSLGDLNWDGNNEIVYSDYHGVVTALWGNGEVLWTRSVSENRCDLPTLVGDVCCSEHMEIVTGDDAGNLFGLSSSGEIIWEASLGSAITTAPVAGHLEPEGPASVFVATKNERLFRLSPDGETIWTAELGGTVDLGSGIVLSDLDGDGIQEIVVSTRNHEMIAFSADGAVLWRVETGAQIRSIPAIGDVDGDGKNEILIGSADWLLYCIDNEGRIEWTYKVGNRVDASPLLVDLNEDGVQDIVLPIRGGDVIGLAGTQ